MASAIIHAVIASKKMNAADIFVYDKQHEKSVALHNSLGINECASLSEACNSSECILLAVKPQDYEELLAAIRECTEKTESKLFVSIAAAISCDYICSMLEVNVPVVRVMPNTPVLLGFGATAISRNSFVSDKDYSKICGIFASTGSVESLDESLMNSVISVNSSSPVYLYMLAKAMIDGSIEQGISEKASVELVYKALRGSCEMLLKSGKTPDELIKTVASPSGTTLAAISSLENDNFYKTVNNAMHACTDRANELSK